MATIELIHKRVGNDIRILVQLFDNDVPVNWTQVTHIFPSLFSDPQRVVMGKCHIDGIDPQDPTTLMLSYSGKSPQYRGLARLVIELRYMGHTCTVDAPAFVFVDKTADEGVGPVDVEIMSHVEPEVNSLQIVVGGGGSASWGTITGDISNQTDLKNALDAKQDTISDLQTIRDGAAAGATAYQKPGTGIPKTDLASGVQTSLGLADSALQPADITALENDVADIQDLIPNAASDTNQLADKAFVNSSVATNTANYISDNGEPFDSLADLEAYSGTLTNNDYAFVVGTDADGNTIYTRYKYNATTQTWAEEYVLNNSSFTSTQWAAINSGIDGTTLQQMLQDIGAAYVVPTGGIPSTDMSQAVQTSLGKADSAYQKPGTGIPKTDLASGVQTSLGLADSALQPADITALENDVADIQDLIPNAASDTNQLADKAFVNSSVATNTANYISDNGEPFDSLADLEAYSGTLTNNDYAFVVGTDADGNTIYTRYKYNATTQTWAEEYVLNNSSFTSTQWAAINSGIDGTTLQQMLQDISAAYVKPSGGIPASDLATGVIPTVPTISTDIETDKTSDTKTASPKAVYDYVGNPVESISTPTPYDGTIIFTHRNGDTDTVDLNHAHPQYYSKAAESSQPVGGFAPDVVYVLGELSGSVTFALASAVSGNVNHYFWTFETGASAPNVTWPAGITWLDGSAPTPGASKHCEVSILGGVGAYMEA